MIHDDYSALSVPYWDDRAKGSKAIGLMNRCAAILRQQGGLLPYDPQVGAVLLTDRDWQAVAKSFGATVVSVQPGMSAPHEVQRPWWTFW